VYLEKKAPGTNILALPYAYHMLPSVKNGFQKCKTVLMLSSQEYKLQHPNNSQQHTHQLFDGKSNSSEIIMTITISVNSKLITEV
jgi:hypothetical protein